MARGSAKVWQTLGSIAVEHACVANLGWLVLWVLRQGAALLSMHVLPTLVGWSLGCMQVFLTTDHLVLVLGLARGGDLLQVGAALRLRFTRCVLLVDRAAARLSALVASLIGSTLN